MKRPPFRAVIFFLTVPAVAWSDTYLPDWAFRTGISWALPAAASDPIAFNDAQIERDWQLSTNNAQSYFGGLTWRSAANVGLNVLVVGPFNHDIRAENGFNSVAVLTGRSGDLGDVSLSLMSFNIEFYAFDKTIPLQPYVSIGINKARFFAERANRNFDAVLTSAVGSASQVERLEIEGSIGLTMGLGVDIDIWGNVGFHSSVMWMDVTGDSTMALVNGQSASSDLAVDPWIINAGLVVKF